MRPPSFSDGSRLVIGATSRLYSPQTEKKPLNGIRISVKDNIDLAGIKTTLSSRSWEKLYPPRQTTAAALQILLDLGAIVVGKTKLSQFAEVEAPTADWVDFHCPFNPRGDGYLTPEGSTTGGAAALAAYEWLDVSIGTDKPYVNPAIRLRWCEAEESTAGGQKAALERKLVFKNWFLDSILAVDPSEGLTTITIVPISDEEPKYRDDYKEYEETLRTDIAMIDLQWGSTSAEASALTSQDSSAIPGWGWG
ncbi:hypothetical protein G7Z17_g4530 [Cylindrodendrum hubeiense]|uniref:Amidase domain-containing protein n=1 Tax=Cylindrodendrum hubeiense TaxID=595255 RepID=A0A9P5HDT6_9HYPO|nr:hypothetical protein G7Z17_g4530 [Cylindrodendrum hubeiense]